MLEYLTKTLGFAYDDEVFQLGEMCNRRRGNCLGLTCLIGAVLLDRGTPVTFEAVVTPHDAAYRDELRYFDELTHGDYFDFEQPALPEADATDPLFRFMSVIHPRLVLGDARLETTSLDDIEDPFHAHEGEAIWPLDYRELMSCVLVDRAKLAADRGESVGLACELTEQALALWRQNREAWSYRYRLALSIFDDDAADEAARRYLELHGSDSLFHSTAFVMTGDDHHLEAALANYRCELAAFYEHSVLRERDTSEARFNFAIAASCAANSEIVSLGDFYLGHMNHALCLFDERTITQLFAHRGLYHHDAARFALARYTVGRKPGDARDLVRQLDTQPHSPRDEACLLRDVHQAIPELDRRWAALQLRHGGSRIWQQEFGSTT